MKEQQVMHSRSRLVSIGFAVKGIKQLVRQEANTRFHLLATALVIAAGIVRQINAVNWLALSIAISLVWVGEAFNTAIECLCDLWCDGNYHPKIKVIKDISAGAVLIAAIASIGIAVIVFFF